MSERPIFTVSQFVDICNQTLDTSFSEIILKGEVSSFKINQGKWVFFDLKDEESSINCFMSLYQMRMPIKDGMTVMLRGTPKLTKWGRFSFTIREVMPVGEGNLKKSFELLKAKLEKEGLFDPAKKRPMPQSIKRIGVISSTGAAGYADFIKIINERWGGLKIDVAHVQVQGLGAAEQIVRALKYFNEHSEVDIVAIIRGGGSADDLAVFNDEPLVREIAASKIPVITGIGHEVDESLSDLAADLRGSTPSNVAQMLTRDKKLENDKINESILRVSNILQEKISRAENEINDNVENLKQKILIEIDAINNKLDSTIKILEALNPEKVLKQGYAIISGKISPGNVVKITTEKQEINAEIKDVKSR